MPALSQRQWNVFLVAVLVAGSLFIAATRVQPSSGIHAPVTQTDVRSDPRRCPIIQRLISRYRSSMGRSACCAICGGRWC